MIKYKTEKNIDSCKTSNNFFASANTGEGFKSYFDINFSPLKLNRIFIIKGGSGTGKSRLMSEIAELCENKHYSVEYFYCSSDITSLDAITVKELGIAVVDGTAPHITDPVYPGAVEKILNLGDFWEENKLISNKSEIFRIVSEKNLNFKNAYKFLKSASEIANAVTDVSERYLDKAKLLASADRIIAKLPRQPESYCVPEDEYKLISSLSSEGYSEFDTFDNLSQRVYLITNTNFSGFIYTENLLPKLNAFKKVISPDPLNPHKIKAIYLKDCKVLFKVCDNVKENKYNADKYSIINMDRFIDADMKRNNKNKLKISRNCYNYLIDGAVECFKSAKASHDALEKVYQNAMDFSQKERFTEEIKEYIMQMRS